jgi:hypothetical protein
MVKQGRSIRHKVIYHQTSFASDASPLRSKKITPGVFCDFLI